MSPGERRGLAGGRLGHRRQPPPAEGTEPQPEEEEAAAAAQVTAVTVMAADAEHIEMGTEPLPSADEAAAAAFAGQGGRSAHAQLPSAPLPPSPQPRRRQRFPARR